MTELWPGRPVAERILSEARKRISQLSGSGRDPPGLVSIAAGSDPAFEAYRRPQRRGAQDLGIRYFPVNLPAESSASALVTEIRRANVDPSMDGILVAHSLPPGMDFQEIARHIAPEKDVDGSNPLSLGLLAAGRPGYVPAVALATRSFLEYHGISTRGKTLVVVGRSSTVGIPTALLYLLRGASGDATVTIAHSQTPDLGEALRSADIVISCAGSPGLLDRSKVRRGSIVLDVGVSIPKMTGGSGVLRGDADVSSLDGWAAAVTPVPGGVGPVTVAHLLASTVSSWARRIEGGALP